MKKIFLISLLIIFLIFIGSACASEDSNLTDNGINLEEPPESIVIKENASFNENNVEIAITEEIYLGNYEKKLKIGKEIGMQEIGIATVHTQHFLMMQTVL